jgi:hypothetical protein
MSVRNLVYMRTSAVRGYFEVNVAVLGLSKYGRHAGHGQRLTPLQCDGKIAGQAREVHWRRVRVHMRQYSHYISEH